MIYRPVIASQTMSVLVQWLMVAWMTSGIGAWRVSGTGIPWIRAIFEEDDHAYISNRGETVCVNLNMEMLALPKQLQTCKKETNNFMLRVKPSYWMIHVLISGSFENVLVSNPSLRLVVHYSILCAYSMWNDLHTPALTSVGSESFSREITYPSTRKIVFKTSQFTLFIIPWYWNVTGCPDSLLGKPNIPIPHIQCHGLYWSGDAGSQSILW